MLAVAHPGPGERQGDRLLGTGHRHIEQAPLLFHIVGRRGHGHAGEEVLLQPGHEHIRELQPLGRMHRHQRDLVVVILFRIHVHAAEQGDVLHIVVESEHGHSRAGLLEFVGIHGLLLPFLHEDSGRVHELVQIRNPGQSLDGSVGLVEGVEPALVGDAHRHVVRIGERYLRGQADNHLAEGLDLRHFHARAQERQGLLPGDVLHGVQRDSAYASGRLVHHPAEGLVVVGVDAELEIGHHVLDFGALEERVARIDHIGDVAATELLLDCARLRIRAVKNREIPVLGMVGTHPGYYFRNYAHSLVLLGIGLQQAYLLTGLPHRIALLGYTARVVGYQGVGRVHDCGRGAVVPLQAEDAAVRIVLAEVQYVLDLRAAEGVDGLAVVAYHADVPVDGRQLLENQVLGVVGVLVLVHHYVEEVLRDTLQRLLVVAQQVVHVQQYVVEVHDPRLLELPLVQLVEVAEARPPGMVVGVQQLAAVAVSADGDQVVLGHGDT